MEEKIIAITNEMAEVLNIAQLKKLQEVLVKAFTTEEPERKPTNHEYLRLFLEAKSIEGCSPRTLQYYEVTVQHLFAAVNLPVRKMTTERMREYLSDYQQRRNCSKATIDNIRRNISSFFSWLEEEDHILKSPMRRIHKIKTKKTVKEVISDEDTEKLRDSCTSLRDLAMIDLLYSTGIRVGELVRLNIEDVNFESRECVVFGKGDKERRVYFDAKTKIHLKNYNLLHVPQNLHPDSPLLGLPADFLQHRLSFSPKHDYCPLVNSLVDFRALHVIHRYNSASNPLHRIGPGNLERRGHHVIQPQAGERIPDDLHPPLRNRQLPDGSHFGFGIGSSHRAIFLLQERADVRTDNHVRPLLIHQNVANHSPLNAKPQHGAQVIPMAQLSVAAAGLHANHMQEFLHAQHILQRLAIILRGDNQNAPFRVFISTIKPESKIRVSPALLSSQGLLVQIQKIRIRYIEAFLCLADSVRNPRLQQFTIIHFIGHLSHVVFVFSFCSCQ